MKETISAPHYKMSFSGELLERGFWLYIWKIRSGAELFFYVGRTGDSSSAHASSPFNRIGQHLDFRTSAKGNSLAKRLSQAGVNPSTSNFQMIAFGPFFPEQPDFESHKPKRDALATLEYEVANLLSVSGHTVIGRHHDSPAEPPVSLEEIERTILDFCSSDD